MIAWNYNFELTPDFIYLIEALKVEGYWSLKHYTLSIQNKDLGFLKHIEEIVKDMGMKISKRILLKLKPVDKDFTKADVFLSYNSRKLNFHIEISPFDGSKKIVTSLPYNSRYILNLKIKNKSYSIRIQESENEIEVSRAN